MFVKAASVTQGVTEDRKTKKNKQTNKQKNTPFSSIQIQNELRYKLGSKTDGGKVLSFLLIKIFQGLQNWSYELPEMLG